MNRMHHEPSRWRSRHAYRIRLLASLGGVLLALNLLVALWPAPDAVGRTGTAYSRYALQATPVALEGITMNAVALPLSPLPPARPTPLELLTVEDELVLEDTLAYLDFSQALTFDTGARTGAGHFKRRASQCRFDDL